MFLKREFPQFPSHPSWGLAGVEGELRGKREVEIPLKLAIVGDEMCRTETTGLWLQIPSWQDAFSAPPLTLHPSLEPLCTHRPSVPWDLK